MYFEQFTLGQRYSLSPVPIHGDRLEAFAREYDPLPIHLDEEYAKTTGFGDIIAPGIMSYMTIWSEFVRLNVWGTELVAGRSANIRWLAPVYAGDLLSGEVTVTGLTRRSARNGMVQFTLEVANQNGVPVIRAVNEAVIIAKGPVKEEFSLPDQERRERFLHAREHVLSEGRHLKGIGTLREKTLHAVLKRYIEPLEDNHETKIGSYVADIVGENGIVEIQTGGFNRLRGKLNAFLEVARVTVVYPIPRLKWLAWVDKDTGEISRKRQSPKQGSFFSAFYELYKIKTLLLHPNLTIRLVLVDIEEYRQLDGWSKDKKRGSSRYERIPLELRGELELGGEAGYSALIPPSLPETFTSRDFQEAAGISLPDAQTALNVLGFVGAVSKCGKRERLTLYRRV